MEDVDMLSLGQHCAFQECRQRDFLPFKCDCCHETYCLEHRTYGAHSCRQADARASTTILCPLCARAVKVGPQENPHAVFESHMAQGCDPSNYAKVMRKKKCPVPGCKEKLTSINTYTCKHCAEAVCLRHRFPEDHSCARRPRPGPGAQQTGAMASLRRLFGGPSTEPTHAVAANAGTGRSAGEAGPAKQPHREPQANGTGEEACPLCGARFRSLSELIAHSTVHDGAVAQPEVCPHCRASFADAVALVEHVERQHRAGATACVLC